MSCRPDLGEHLVEVLDSESLDSVIVELYPQSITDAAAEQLTQIGSAILADPVDALRAIAKNPELGQIGNGTGIATRLGVGIAKRLPLVGTGVTVGQGIMDYADGTKSGVRAKVSSR